MLRCDALESGSRGAVTCASTLQLIDDLGIWRVVTSSNGDAHLKNWSVIYRDKVTPQLAPVYDLVSTIQYVANDTLALKLAGERRFASIDETHFDRLARRMEAPPKFVLNTVKETVATAGKEWPGIIREVGLPENMRERLYGYWGGLSGLLRITQ